MLEVCIVEEKIRHVRYDFVVDILRFAEEWIQYKFVEVGRQAAALFEA